ncbi:BamA/TamA family outer membrane protein [candidate division KSB1 bacterium]|nr:BamA/TamA family outer membrane protein [candidate division KSB1 bacterium]
MLSFSRHSALGTFIQDDVLRVAFFYPGCHHQQTALRLVLAAIFLLGANPIWGFMPPGHPQENFVSTSVASRDTSHGHASWQQPAQIFTPRLDRAVGPPNYFLPHRELSRARVGLALSGGGARALFQIGVLQALEEHGIAIDFIAGTSMGSVVGGLYAAGYNVTQLYDIALTIPWDDITVDTPPRTNLFLAQRQERERAFLQVRFRGVKPYIPPAITAGQKLMTVLADLTMRANYRASAGFDHLRIPFRAMATDLYSGKEIIIADGDLAEAMRASLAVPFLFSPLARGDMLLADGGLVNNIPVNVVRQHADVVIAADASSKLRDKDNLNSPWELADQVSTIMQHDENEAQRQKADVVITLDEPGRTSSDFTAIDSLIELGYRKTLEQIGKIQQLTQQRPTDSTFAANAQKIFAVHYWGSQNGAATATRRLWNVAFSNGAAAAPEQMPPDLPWAMLEAAAGKGVCKLGDSSNKHLVLGADAIQSWVEAVYAAGQYAAVRAELRADTLMLIVQENPRLRRIRFAGNTIYADSTLLACVQSQPGEAINHRRSAEDLVAIVERYRDDGYALAEIRGVKLDTATGLLQIDIDEGYIGAIEIEGNQRTKPFVILREFPQKEGNIFNSNICSRGVRNIHSTGLFDQVALNIRRGPGGAIVKIKVQEKPFTVLRLGGRYDTERDTRGFIEAGDENAFGTGSKIFAYQEIGSRDVATRLTLRSDRILKTYLSLSTNLYHQARENFVYRDLQSKRIGVYTDDRLGLHLAFGQQMRRIGVVTAELRLEEVNLKLLDGGGFPTGNTTLNALILRSAVDTRDRLPFPRRGRYVHVFYENVYADLGEDDSFFRFFLRLETFHSRGPHTFHPKLSLGASDQTTPFSEQFRLGGPDDVYGLREHELIGRHFALGSLEYRYQLRRKPLFDLYLSFRYDLSGLWIDKRDANYRKFHHAFGVSLGCETPLGPISVAYGVYENIRQRVYVSAGYSF